MGIPKFYRWMRWASLLAIISFLIWCECILTAVIVVPLHVASSFPRAKLITFVPQQRTLSLPQPNCGCWQGSRIWQPLSGYEWHCPQCVASTRPRSFRYFHGAPNFWCNFCLPRTSVQHHSSPEDSLHGDWRVCTSRQDESTAGTPLPLGWRSGDGTQQTPP